MERKKQQPSFFSRLVGDNSFTDAFATATHDEFVRDARTGDILLAASRGLSAAPTRMYSSEPWTHVGLVCRMRQRNAEDLRIVEFSGHNPSEEIYKVNADADDRRMVRGDGMGLYDLDDFFLNNGGIYWRPLGSDAPRKKIAETMREMLTAAEGHRFADTTAILSTSLFGARLGGGIVCSTVVAMALNASGVLNLQKEVSRYIPSDFARDDAGWICAPREIRCVMGYSSRIFRGKINVCGQV